METIYYGHVPLAHNRQTSKGYPGVVLRATRGNRNNIPYKPRAEPLYAELRAELHIELCAKLCVELYAELYIELCGIFITAKN
jgi:hypothetical protein